MNKRTFLIVALSSVLFSVRPTPAAAQVPPALLIAVTLGQAWRPTIDNESRYPTGLPAAQRAKVLASLDALLPIVQRALDTQGVQFRAQRSFANDPQLPQGPFPLNLLVQGFEQQADGTFEGEAATNIDLYVNDLKPLLSIAQDEPRVWLLKEDGVKRGNLTIFGNAFTLVSKGGVVPLKAMSKEEFARRVEARLTRQRNEKTLALLRADLAALSAAQRAEPMLLPRAYNEDKPWPGFNGGVRPAVDIDPAYFDMTKRDVPQVLLLTGGVNRGVGHERAVERLQKFGRTLDYEGLRALLR
jgi:hypothetical protein